MSKTRLMAGAAVVGLALAGVGQARAETLADAIALAYQSNPTLQGQRAQQRALDETYVQARAGYRPTLSASGSMGYQYSQHGLIDANTGSVALSASQPIYTGGRVSAAVSAAEAQVLAGREGLRAVEAQVLQAVIQAYQDVRRDLTILGIREKNVEVLSNQLQQTQVRFEVGQVTRTDVAQAEAQVAASRALLAGAQAQLQISRAAYATVVGQNPGALADSPPLPGLPATVDLAFEAADNGNGNLRRARLAEVSSRARIAQARAAGHPTAAISASLGYSGPISPFDTRDYSRNVTIQGVVSQPLFTGGLVQSGVRQALEQNTADRIAIEGVRRQVVQAVSQAWNVMGSTRASMTANAEQVRAATVAFTGIQEQYQVGISTILDVLVAQTTLRDAELFLAQSTHDYYVAQASLLNAMGRLEAGALVSGSPLYDATANFNQVKIAGTVPWEGLVRDFDAVGAPSPTAAVSPIPAPAAPTGAVAMIPAPAPPAKLDPSTTLPIGRAPDR
ncbi:MAG: TolC family outer membrane protein [Caulobacteraceae bacterium]